MEGWIRYHRRTLDHWIWKSDKYFKAWTYILFRANYKPNKILVGATMIQLARGEFITSRQNFAKDTGMTEREVRTFWSLLETDKMIVRKSTSKMTMIIVCNYDSYQVDQPANDQPATSKRPANDQPATTEKKVKKVNTDKEEINVREFYKSEFEKAKGSGDQKVMNGFFRFIGTIWNEGEYENATGKPAKHILQLPAQITFKQYSNLADEARKRQVKLLDLLDVMINDAKYTKGKNSIYLTLLNWVKREELKGTNHR